MKHALKTVPFLLILLILFSCGDRKTPVAPGVEYSIAGTLAPVGIFKHIDVLENSDLAYISADYMALLEVDLSNPANPVIVDTIQNDFMGEVWSSVISEVTGYGYVETDASNWATWAIRAFPMDSIKTSSYHIINTASPPVDKFDVQEFVRDSSGTVLFDSVYIYILDNTEWNNFQRQYFYFNGLNWAQGAVIGYPTQDVYDFDVQDDYAYLALDEYGAVILDLLNNAAVIGEFDTEGYCRGIDTEGDYCYLADWHWGLQVLDVSDPANPVRVANLKFDGADDCEKVKVLGDRAVVMDKYNGFYAVDISNPANPQTIFNVDTITPTDFVLTEEYIYVVDEDAGLIVISW